MGAFTVLIMWKVGGYVRELPIFSQVIFCSVQIVKLPQLYWQLTGVYIGECAVKIKGQNYCINPLTFNGLFDTMILAAENCGLICGSAGIGRQARLRGVCPSRMGSSPIDRTKKNENFNTKIADRNGRLFLLCHFVLSFTPYISAFSGACPYSLTLLASGWVKPR